MSQNKEEYAIRLLEALSDVDPELLERSEKAVPAKKGKIINFYSRAGKICAACLCLVVVGSAFYAMQSGLFNMKSAESSDNAGAAYLTAPAAETYQEKYDNVMIAEEADTGVEEGLTYGADPKWLTVNEYATNSAADPDKQAVQDQKEQKPLGSKRESSTTEASKDYGQLIGERLPRTYSLYATDAREYELYYMYRNDEDESETVWIKVTGVDEATAEALVAENAAIDVKSEDWTEKLPETWEAVMQLAFIDKDGVLVEYYGCLSREEVIALWVK